MIKRWQTKAHTHSIGGSPIAAFARRHWLKILMLSLALSVLAVALSRQQLALKAFNQAQQHYRQQQSIHQTAAANSALLAVYQNPYQQLQASGRIGPAQRLQWVEALSAGVNQLAVPQVRFTLDPTSIATSANSLGLAEGEGLSLTPMRLDFTLLHEGDFYRLMMDLRQRALGLVSVQNCTLRRKDAGSIEAINDFATSDAAPRRISGECELLWYSLEAIPALVE